MAHPTPEKIADIILGRRQVYGLDTDTRIREAANLLTARALFELLRLSDDESEDFRSQLAGMLSTCDRQGLSGVIGFHTGDSTTAVGETDSAEQHHTPTEFYLRLIFSSEDAAYYQFHLFPNLEADYVLGAARKRTGAVQHLRLQLSRPEALQYFVEKCRSNPHFIGIEESTAEQFDLAPSNAI